MATSKRGTWATIRRIAASDRISGLIMLGFALAGLLLANLPFTAHAFEQLENFRIAIPHTNIDMGLGHWVQDGLLTVFFLPLCGAALHMAFAFPMVRRMLLLFQLTTLRSVCLSLRLKSVRFSHRLREHSA